MLKLIKDPVLKSGIYWTTVWLTWASYCKWLLYIKITWTSCLQKDRVARQSLVPIAQQHIQNTYVDTFVEHHQLYTARLMPSPTVAFGQVHEPVL